MYVCSTGRAFRFLPDSFLRNKLASDHAHDDPETGFDVNVENNV